MVCARSLTSLTSTLCLVQGRLMPTLSASWNASLPIRSVETWPVKATRGTESMYASASPVTMFVIPGPEVTKTTPALPVALAYPSAIWAAPCSCLVSTSSISFCWHSTSKIFNTTPPGNPKTVLTPSRLNDSQNISAPVIFILLPLLNSALAIATEDLHNLILTRQFHFLQPFLLDFLVRRKMKFMLELIELFLQLLMLFIILLELGI